MAQVGAQHILVETQEQALALHKQIQEGADFGQVAQQNSKCPSGQQGGNLGMFQQGMMVPQFEQAAFALEVGGLSEPVETQFGWHLIKRTA